MGRALYEAEPVFRAEVDRCAELSRAHLDGVDVRAVLYPRPEDREACAQQLARTALTQPALFILEYATARLWMSWGVKPAAMLGHSIGEYVAACLAGVFSLEEALHLVATRGRLMQHLPSGAMLAVSLSEEEVRPYLDAAGAELSLAAVNAPMQCVLSGTDAAVEAARRRLEEAGAQCRVLVTSHAFHSAMMDPILADFAARVSSVPLKAPTVPVLSNVTGTWLTAEQATSPRYWAEHLRGTVRFEEGLRTLASDARRVLLEVGPGQTLERLARRHPALASTHPVLASMASPRDDGAPADASAPLVYQTLGRLWQAGVGIDWKAFHGGEPRHRVVLPTYPFERQRHWVEPAVTSSVAPSPLVTSVATAPETSQAPETEVVPARPCQPRPSLRSAFVAPSTPLQRSLVELWQEMLGVAPIGIQDNFFELGGDSLIAVQLSGRIKKQLGLEVPASSLYEGVTVEALAALLAPPAPQPRAPVAEPGAALHQRKQALARQRTLRRSDDEFEDL